MVNKKKWEPVLRSLGKHGYLKFPKEFCRLMTFTGKSIPSPKVKVQLDEKRGKARIVFEWNVKKLTEESTWEPTKSNS